MEGEFTRLKKKVVLLMLLLLTFMIGIPSDALAEDKEKENQVGPNSSIENFLPDSKPIPKEKGEETPLYERHPVVNYQVDFEKSSGFMTTINILFSWLNVFNTFAWVLGIYLIQWVFTTDFYEGYSDVIGSFLETMRDELFLGPIMVTGLVILVITMAISFFSSGQLSKILKKFLIMALLVTAFMSFGSEILDGVNNLEASVSDGLFWIYLISDPTGNHSDLKEERPDQGQGILKKYQSARNKTLVHIGNQMFENFPYRAWQMATLGKAVIPIARDDEGNPVWSGTDQIIKKDSETLLSLSPTSPSEFIAREEQVTKWSGSSIWAQYMSELVVTPVKKIQKAIDTLTDNDDPPPRYPALTEGNTVGRVIVVGAFSIVTFFYLGLLITLGLTAIIAKQLTLILTIASIVVALSIFVPVFGERVQIMWIQTFLLSGMYKIIISIILICMLFFSSTTIHLFEKLQWDMAFFYMMHIGFVFAVLIFHKWLWNVFSYPGRMALEGAENWVQQGQKKMLDLTKGAVKTTVGTTAAIAGAAIGSPAILGSKKGIAGLAGRMVTGLKGSRKKDPRSSEGNIQLASNYIPEGYTPASGMKGKAQALDNPYPQDSMESHVFDDMKEKGFNPYSGKDQQAFLKNLKGKSPEYKEAFQNVKGVSRQIGRNYRSQQWEQRKSNVMNTLDQMIEEENRRNEQPKKKRSSRILNNMRARMWGRK